MIMFYDIMQEWEAVKRRMQANPYRTTKMKCHHIDP
jgi:hypothetical protein